MNERETKSFNEVMEIIMIYPEFKDKFLTAVNGFFADMDEVNSNPNLSVEEKAEKFQEIGERHAMPVMDLIPES